MFQTNQLKNLPTTSKPGGRPGIFKVCLCSAVFVVGFLKILCYAEHKQKATAYCAAGFRANH